MKANSKHIEATAIMAIMAALTLPPSPARAQETSRTLSRRPRRQLQFEEGYCQAAEYSGNPSQDSFAFHYYDRDHLGSIRLVIKAIGSSQGNIVQTLNYYPVAP